MMNETYGSVPFALLPLALGITNVMLSQVVLKLLFIKAGAQLENSL